MAVSVWGLGPAGRASLLTPPGRDRQGRRGCRGYNQLRPVSGWADPIGPSSARLKRVLPEPLCLRPDNGWTFGPRRSGTRRTPLPAFPTSGVRRVLPSKGRSPAGGRGVDELSELWGGRGVDVYPFDSGFHIFAEPVPVGRTLLTSGLHGGGGPAAALIASTLPRSERATGVGTVRSRGVSGGRRRVPGARGPAAAEPCGPAQAVARGGAPGAVGAGRGPGPRRGLRGRSGGGGGGGSPDEALGPDPRPSRPARPPAHSARGRRTRGPGIAAGRAGRGGSGPPR